MTHQTKKPSLRFLTSAFALLWYADEVKEFDVNVFTTITFICFIHSKIFQSDWKQRSQCEKFTAHYACRNADLNLRLVVAVSNRFIFQIIDSLMQSWGVRLTVTFFTSLRSKSLQLTRKSYRILLWNCLLEFSK